MPKEMRTVYHEKLSELSEQLGQLCGMAGAAMERATGRCCRPTSQRRSK